MIRALLVDDQRSLRRSLALLLQNLGMATAEAASGSEALEKLATANYDVVITDLRMEGMSGTELLREIKKRYPALPVIVITAYGSIESAVDAMRSGAFDYLTKPFEESDIVDKIRGACSVSACEVGLDSGNGADRDRADCVSLVGESPQMQAVLIRVERMAQTELSVLITGETGTGKSKMAQLIHDKSLRRAGPFISVNCASLPESLLESELFGHARGSFTGATDARVGLFEAADRGTIFLDEIDTLSPGMQAKLLSVLQERQIRRVGSNHTRKVDIRVISASNQEIQRLLNDGRFRQDLYYRLNGVRLHLPPLRERDDDLRLLVERFLQIYARKYGHGRITLTARALACVCGYGYPGNIRQLESVIEQMVVFADENGMVDMDALPEELLHGVVPVHEVARLARTENGLSLEKSERLLIESALERFDNLSDAAKELGIGRTTLWRKMRQYNIQRLSKDGVNNLAQK